MRHALLGGVVAVAWGMALASTGAAQPVAKPATRTIPTAFRGHWEERADLCADGLSNQGMVISARRIQLFELRISFRGVDVISSTAIHLSGQIEDGPGNHWGSDMTLALTDGGTLLHTGDGDGNPIYTRCPATGAQR